MPTVPRRCGSALQELHCPLPTGSEAVHHRSSIAHCPKAVRQCIARVALPSALQEFHCPLPQAVRQCIAGVALPSALQELHCLVHCMSCTAHSPRQCCSALQELQCPLPAGSEAVHCRSCIAHCPQAVWQCIAGVALPSSLQELHCPLPAGSETLHCKSCSAHSPRRCGSALRELHCPLPPGIEAVHCRSCTATAPEQCGSALQGFRSLGSDCLLGRTQCPPSWWARALQEFHCPQPPDGVAVHCRTCTAHCPQAVRQCIVGVALPTAPRQ